MLPAEVIILQTFLNASSDIVSGGSLARTLGMSRVAVWQHLEKLRAQGFDFEALRAKGYRLTKQPDAFSAALIDAHRQINDASPRLIVIEETDSTNDEALRRLSAREPTPFVILAHRQTRGRGRFGRTWYSERGNLYASFVFRPELEPVRMQTFTLWMGVNVCDLIAKFFRISPKVKWPNDILLDERKTGGILTEARMDADCIRDLIFGIGLNLAPPKGGWPGEIAHRTSALSEHTGQPVDANRFAAALINRVFSAYRQFVETPNPDNFADLWNRYDLLRERRITLLQGERRITGIARGIDNEGSLLLKPDDGPSQRFRAGEVSIEKRY